MNIYDNDVYSDMTHKFYTQGTADERVDLSFTQSSDTLVKANFTPKLGGTLQVYVTCSTANKEAFLTIYNTNTGSKLVETGEQSTSHNVTIEQAVTVGSCYNYEIQISSYDKPITVSQLQLRTTVVPKLAYFITN